MIEIRHAGLDDTELISDIGAKSFFDAFAEHNTNEDIDKYLTEKFSKEHIKGEISDPLASFFMAYYMGKPAGYAKIIQSPLPEQMSVTPFHPAEAGFPSPKGWEITTLKAIEMQRIYVLKEYYSMKIGKELMQFTIDFSVNKGFNAMWLGVWQLNHRAVEFYKKWGFEIFGTRKFKLGSCINDDYLMIKKF